MRFQHLSGGLPLRILDALSQIPWMKRLIFILCVLVFDVLIRLISTKVVLETDGCGLLFDFVIAGSGLGVMRIAIGLTITVRSTITADGEERPLLVAAVVIDEEDVAKVE
ncbi:hypothetical protein ACLOJK_000230 [Asimina triloba]